MSPKVQVHWPPKNIWKKNAIAWLVRVEVISFKARVCPFHWHLKIFQIQMFNEKHKAEITNTLCLATSHRVCSTRHGENPFGKHRNLRSNNAVDDHQALVLQTMRLVNMLQSGKHQLTWIAWIQVCISKLLTTFCPARPRCKFRHHPKASDANGLRGAGYPKIAGDNIPGNCGQGSRMALKELIRWAYKVT